MRRRRFPTCLAPILVCHLLGAAGACRFVEGLSGATGKDLKDLHRAKCSSVADHEYIEIFLSARGTASVEQRSPASAGACVEKDTGCDGDAVLKLHLETMFADGCREGQPTLRHMWPREGEIGSPEGYAMWLERLQSQSMPTEEVISWPALLECPAAACAALTVHTLGAASKPSGLLEILGFDPQVEDSQKLILDATRRMQFCYDELLANAHQQQLIGWLGMLVAALELALAHLRRWSHEIRPRNPHHEEGRTVWHDYYSGLYPPVNYSEQFDLQWQLALERPESDFAKESSVRLDDCALNDMIASTFGVENHLPNCSVEMREGHERLERGISRQNFVTLDVSRFADADALDVGCGFGRWTAMLLRIGAKVTSVDASPHAVKSTKRYNPETYQMSLFDLPSLPGYEAGYDLVVCWGVLHHTHNPLQGFRTVAGALREGGVLFLQVYNDRAKAGFHYTQSFRARFHQLQSTEEKLEFLRTTHRVAGADIFDHLDGMLTFYNWVVHEEVVRNWFLSNGFADYWKVWNYKYLGRKRPLLAPIRDDSGMLLSNSIGETIEEGRNYPIIGF